MLIHLQVYWLELQMNYIFKEGEQQQISFVVLFFGGLNENDNISTNLVLQNKSNLKIICYVCECSYIVQFGRVDY